MNRPPKSAEQTLGRESIEVVAEAFVAQVRADKAPTVDEMAERYPHLADEIRVLFPAMLLLENAGRQASPSPESASPAASELVDGVSTDANLAEPTVVRHAALDETRVESPAPDRVGRFEIVRPLGEGGFAVVYLAYDPQLGRRVALKIPKSQMLLTSGALERFEREARAAGILSHPAIVPIYEAGQVNGIAYIASAYCPGVTLAAWLAEHRGDVTNRLAAMVIACLADAVQHAHVRGVVHRDLKPGNVLLDTLDVESNDPHQFVAQLRVADFGLARYADEGEQTVTQVGDVVGTLAYMAPEQARGAIDEVGPATDIFALGTILYELLTGDPPHRHASQLATLSAIESEPAVPPRRRNRGVPVDLDAICLKCLEKEPHRRYPSAEDLAADLRRFTQGEPVRARHSTWLERAEKWCRRSPAVAAATLIAVTSLVVGLCLTTWQWMRADQNLALANRHHAEATASLRVANVERARAEANARRAEQAIDRMLEEASASLENVPQMERVRGRLLELALRLQVEMLDESSHDPRVQLQTAAAYRRMGNIELLLGHHDQAGAAVESGLRVIDAVGSEARTGTWRLEKARLLLLLHTIAELGSRTDEAMSAAEQAIELLAPSADAAFDQAHAMYLAEAYRSLGATYEKLGRMAEAVDALQAAVDRLEHVPEGEQSDRRYLFNLAKATNSLAICLRGNGRLPESEAAYRRVLEIGEPLGESHPEWRDVRSLTAAACMNLANLSMFRRNLSQAVDYYLRCRDMYSRLAVENPSTPVFALRVASASTGIGSAYGGLDRPQEARTAFETAIASLRRFEEEQGTSEAVLAARSVACNNLGNLLRDEFEDFASAEQMFTEAVAICRGLIERAPKVPRHHNSLGLAYANLSNIYLERSEPVAALDALQHAERAIDNAISLNPREARFHFARRSVLGGQSEALCALGRHDDALAVLDPFDDGHAARPQDYLRLARSLGRNVRAIQEGGDAPADRRRDVVERYAVKVVAVLRAAAELGFHEFPAIAETDEMEFIRDRADFQALLEEFRPNP